MLYDATPGMEEQNQPGATDPQGTYGNVISQRGGPSFGIGSNSTDYQLRLKFAKMSRQDHDTSSDPALKHFPWEKDHWMREQGTYEDMFSHIRTTVGAFDQFNFSYVAPENKAPVGNENYRNFLRANAHRKVAVAPLLTAQEKANGVKSLTAFQYLDRLHDVLGTDMERNPMRGKSIETQNALKFIILERRNECLYQRICDIKSDEQVIVLDKNRELIQNLLGPKNIKQCQASGIDLLSIDYNRLNKNGRMSYSTLQKDLMACSDQELRERFGEAAKGADPSHLRKMLKNRHRQLVTEAKQRSKEEKGPGLLSRTMNYTETAILSTKDGSLEEAFTHGSGKLFVNAPLDAIIGALRYIKDKVDGIGTYEKIADANKSMNEHMNRPRNFEESYNNINRWLHAQTTLETARKTMLGNDTRPVEGNVPTPPPAPTPAPSQMNITPSFVSTTDGSTRPRGLGFPSPLEIEVKAAIDNAAASTRVAMAPPARTQQQEAAQEGSITDRFSSIESRVSGALEQAAGIGRTVVNKTQTMTSNLRLPPIPGRGLGM